MASTIDSDTTTSDALQLERINLDLRLRQDRYRPRLEQFLVRHRAHLGLPAGGDLVMAYLQRVWSPGLPSTAIIANISFDTFGRWLLRPPVDGPLAQTFAAGHLAPALGAYRRQGALIVDRFEIAPHVPPRSFERLVTARIQFDATVEAMTFKDLQTLESLPRHRLQTRERLQKWREYLDWREKLIHLARVAVRYESYEVNEDGEARFSLAGAHDSSILSRRLNQAAMQVASLAASRSVERWDPNPKQRAPIRDIGRVARITPQAGSRSATTMGNSDPADTRSPVIVTVKLEADALESIDQLIPSEGFLLTAIGGDLKPLLRERRAIDRLCSGQGYNPTLADWMFDITRAAVPAPSDAGGIDFQDTRLDPEQKAAVAKSGAAPDICLVLGPPGTGKTETNVHIAMHHLFAGGRVLIASQTNMAVDNALGRLANRPEVRPLRIAKADRIEEGFEGLLEAHVIGHWFEVIRRGCQENLDGWDRDDQSTRRAEEAASSLQRILEDADEAQRHITAMETENSALTTERSQLGERLQAAEEQIETHERRTRAARDLASWLSDPSGPPAGAELIKDDAAPLNATIQELRRAVGERRWELPWPAHDALAAYRLAHQGMRASVDLLNVLPAAIDLCANAIPASQADADRLRELLTERTQLLESEKEEDVARVAGLNRRIKRIREDEWASLCLQFRAPLTVLFDHRIPQDLDELTVTLGPDRAYLAPLTELLEFCRRLAEAINQTMIAGRSRHQERLTARSSELEAEAASLRNHADTLRQQIQLLDDQSAELQDRLGDARRRHRDCEQRWTQRWPDLWIDPSSMPAVTSLSATALRERVDASRASRLDRTKELQHRERWRPLLNEWVRRLADPKAADRPALRSLYVKHANVVGLTCFEAGDRNFHERSDFEPFDVVIIDEVSKATPTELLMPMLLGRKVVLVGDPRQLPPMFREDERSFTEAAAEGQIDPADFQRFKRFVGSSFFAELFDTAAEPVRHSLLKQYRFHPQIMAAVNQFYDGRLEAGHGEQRLSQLRQHYLSIPDGRGGWLLEPHHHLLWIDSAKDALGRPAFEEQRGSSKINRLEVELVAQMLIRLNAALRGRGYGPPIRAEGLPGNMTTRAWVEQALHAAPETLDELFSRGAVRRNGHPAARDDVVLRGDTLDVDPRKSVGVITFYGAQLAAIRQRIAQLGESSPDALDALDLRTNTVDRFQGMERSIVLVSLVRALPYLRGGEYVRQYQRINVALSRARDLLVIIGSERMFRDASVDLPPFEGGPLRQVPVYRNIFQHVQQSGGRRYASQLLR